MAKVLEQLKLQTGKHFMGYFIIFLLGLALSQVSCSTNGEQKTLAQASPTIEIDTKSKVTQTPDLTQKRLTQEQTLDISKLIERFQSATEDDREMAQKMFDESKKEFEKRKYTIAGQGFIASITDFPRVDSLIMSGESVANSDVSDQPKNEAVLYKLKQFKESVKYFDLAIEFANKTQQTNELKEYPNLNKNIDCLNNFITEKSNKEKSCEFINDILKANNISEFNK